MIEERVNAQQVMHFVVNASPDMSWNGRAEVIGVNPRRLLDYRKQPWVRRQTAEKILDAFDLGYLLYTGDIEIDQHELKYSQTQMLEQVQNTNRQLREKNRQLTTRVKTLERKLASLSPQSKDSVKALDRAA